MPNLPGLNFASSLDIGDLEFEFNVYEEEFLERLRLAMGHPNAFHSTAFGIVAPTDPKAHLTASSDPMVVRVNTGNPIKIDILPGIAVTKTGFRIVLTSTLEAISLTSTVAGVENVIALKYSTVEDPNTKVNKFNLGVSPKRTVLSDEIDYVVVMTMTEWNALATSDRENRVALAVITVVVDSTGSSALSIDLTGTSFAFNRPWFSLVDVAHREHKGTGPDDVPHNLSLNDLGASTKLTLFQTLLDYGIIISKDVSAPRVPGTLCTQVIPSASFLTDDGAGTVTGVPNVQYAQLGLFPIALGMVTDNATETEIFACYVIPESDLLVVNPNETISTDAKVYMIRAECGEPLNGAALTALTVKAPTDNEAFIANGIVFDEFDSLSASFSDAGPFPMEYHVFGYNNNKLAQLAKAPQVLMPYTKLDDIGTGSITVSTTMLGNAKILVGLDRAVDGPTLDVQIRLDGNDEDGNTISEVVAFGATWGDNDPVPSCGVSITSSKLTTNLFSELISVSIDTRANDGPDSAILVWASLNPVDTEVYRDSLPISDVVWDGTRLCNVHDVRAVNTRAQHEENRIEYLLPAVMNKQLTDSGITASNVEVLWVEDFRRPRLGSLITENNAGSLEFRKRRRKHTEYFKGFYESRALPLGGIDELWIIPIPNDVVDPGGFSHNYGSMEFTERRYLASTALFTAYSAVAMNGALITTGIGADFLRLQVKVSTASIVGTNGRKGLLGYAVFGRV